MKKTTAWQLLALILLLTAAPVVGAATFTRADWEGLQQWQFSSGTVPVPADGLSFTIDQARWNLTSGTLRFMKPVRGVTTGLLFEGSGTMSMAVPDRVELAQLRRMAGDSSLNDLQLSFNTLVLRSSAMPFDNLIPASAEEWKAHPITTERHDTLIELGGIDPDARIIAALTDPGDRYSLVDMKTDRWDWVRFTSDEKQSEEIEVVHLNRRYPEVWISLDQKEEQLRGGRPAKTFEPRARLEHLQVRADLTRRGRGSSVGKSRTNPINAQFTSTVTTVPLNEGMTSLHFTLHPYAKVSEVTGPDGETLDYLRDHRGKRAFSLDNDLYDEDLLVLFPDALHKGEPVEVTVEYELEITNYVSGNSWYPTISTNYLENHTAELELTAPLKYDVYAMGSKTDTRRGPDSETTVWSITKPTPMVTFAVGKDFKTKEIEMEESTNVVAFGPVMGLGRGDMIGNVAADVANSTRFFSWLFDRPLSNDTLYVTSIAASHGQAFDGFLHMSEETFDSEHPGASELFRAHEVAHQWWGHEVGWQTYRDQWLSESFAEYAAMMFVQAAMNDDGKTFEEILDVYTNMLNGSLRGAYSKFSRPWLIEMNDNSRGRLGAIDVGYRAGTAEMPGGYIIQSYYKGPLVIHMLRTMLLNQTRSEDGFITVMRDFLATYSGESATTEDLQRILEKHYPGDWSWFFDQWIYRSDIPTLQYAVDNPRSANAKGTYTVTVRVKKTDVPADFVTPVPIRMELASGQVATVTAVVRQAEQTFEYELPSRPKSVEFNAGHGILAAVRKM